MDKKAVAVFAENLAVKDISNEATIALIHDAELKIRQIISLALTFMKRSHRQILECKDIKRAMKTLNLDVFFT
jgi:Transcription initiation factor TFIID, subunit TAF6 (also component of histone acetyltransferase SAGA)